jgi:hypothetical protein
MSDSHALPTLDRSHSTSLYASRYPLHRKARASTPLMGRWRCPALHEVGACDRVTAVRC